MCLLTTVFSTPVYSATLRRVNPAKNRSRRTSFNFLISIRLAGILPPFESFLNSTKQDRLSRTLCAQFLDLEPAVFTTPSKRIPTKTDTIPTIADTVPKTASFCPPSLESLSAFLRPSVRLPSNSCPLCVGLRTQAARNAVVPPRRGTLRHRERSLRGALRAALRLLAVLRRRCRTPVKAVYRYRHTAFTGILRAGSEGDRRPFVDGDASHSPESLR